MSDLADLTLRCPFTAVVSGGTGSGKTTFLSRVILNAQSLYNKNPGPMFFFYNIWQPLYDELKDKVTFIQGMCTMKWIKENIVPGTNATLFLDDLGSQLTDDTSEIFTVASHHYSTNIWFLVHNLFQKSGPFRTISLNSHYLVIFKNPRDASSITNFARQFDTGHAKRTLSIFREATQRPFTYLFLDLTQEAEDKFRLRSNIFYEGGLPLAVYERLD